LSKDGLIDKTSIQNAISQLGKGDIMFKLWYNLLPPLVI